MDLYSIGGTFLSRIRRGWKTPPIDVELLADTNNGDLQLDGDLFQNFNHHPHSESQIFYSNPFIISVHP